jgi:non-ribosomal peptide synthase protein (TIGR01720 family)
VGWFTAIFPVRFDIAGDALEDHLLGVHATLESVPSGGAGFGVLRHLAALSEGDQAHLDQLQPAISFNYLGNIDIGPVDFGTQRSDFESGDGADAMKLRFSERSPGENISSLNPLPHDLQLEGVMKGGSLSFTAYFNPSVYTPASIKSLMNLFETQLRQIAIHYERTYTSRNDSEIAQDFSANDLNQEELELIKGALEN